MDKLTNDTIRSRITEYFENPDGSIPYWDVSEVTDMNSLFLDKSMFNEPLHHWVVSKVKDMSNMFKGCTSFNQDLSDWDVSEVEYMSGMFIKCIHFDKELKWTTTKVKDMSYMFKECFDFNKPLHWDVSSVITMSCMFEQCDTFDKPLHWDVSNVENMSCMFEHCKSFNSSLTSESGHWIVSKVTDMAEMFIGCILFNQDISMWDVSSVQNMYSLFYNCESFDQDLSGWDVSNVTSYDYIFDDTFNKEYMPKFESEDFQEFEDLDQGVTRECNQLFSDYLKVQKMRYLDELYRAQHPDLERTPKKRKVDSDELLLEFDKTIPWELGLNCRYGVELEFTHASLNGRTTRYVLGNRINNCIVSRNAKEFYSYQFDLKDPESIFMQQQRSTHTEVTPDENFNQWSNFLTEVMSVYHAPTHNRLPTDTDNGRDLSGFKIEYDPGIVYNGLMFKGRDSNIRNSEYSSDSVNELGHYDKDYVLDETRKESLLTMWKNGSHPIDPTIITMTSGDASIDVVRVKDVMDLFENISIQTELVTPILVDEPFKIGDVYYPYGVIALENMISHMKSHSNVIFVHNDGLHIHLSKNLNSGEFTTAEVIGLIKLFWMFEPLFLAAEPTYRAKNAADGYRSLQSIFSYNDMLHAPDNYIIEVLTGNHVKVIRDSRYVSLNIMNLLPNKIGTVEYRIGHGTFDGKSIQLHTHLLQVLFQFNIAITQSQGNYHERLLKHLYMLYAMPSYVHSTGYLRGFNIFNMTIAQRTEMIFNLAKCFALSTGAVKGVTMLLDYIELYHTYCETSPQGSYPTEFPGYYMNDIEPLKAKWTDWLESIDPIETIKFHYFESPDKFGMDTEACSHENILYNSGNPLVTSYESRIPTDVSHEYSDIPDDQDEDSLNIGKIQTELINSKLYGGKRTRHFKKRTRRLKGGKRTRRNKPRTQTAGFVKSANIPKVDLTNLKPELTNLTNDLKSEPPKIKPFHKVFNMNRSLDLYDMHEDVHNMIGYTILISYPCKFTDMSNINIRLSSVASRLIDKKIITMNQLRTLVKFKYIDTLLYLDEPNCFAELIQIMDMTPELFTKIKDVYKQVDTEKYSDENIVLDLGKYLRTGEKPTILHYKY